MFLGFRLRRLAEKIRQYEHRIVLNEKMVERAEAAGNAAVALAARKRAAELRAELTSFITQRDELSTLMIPGAPPSVTSPLSILLLSSVILAVFSGFMLLERYSVARPGGVDGLLVKTDRWTGKTWIFTGEGWRPVNESDHAFGP